MFGNFQAFPTKKRCAIIIPLKPPTICKWLALGFQGYSLKVIVKKMGPWCKSPISKLMKNVRQKLCPNLERFRKILLDTYSDTYTYTAFITSDWTILQKKLPSQWVLIKPLLQGSLKHMETLMIRCSGPSISQIHHVSGPIMAHLGVSENSGTPKSSILIGFSIIKPSKILGYPYFWKHHLNMNSMSQRFGDSSCDLKMGWWSDPNLENKIPDLQRLGIKKESRLGHHLDQTLAGGWTNPSEKYVQVKLHHFPNFRDEHKKQIFETTTQDFLVKKRVMPMTPW